MITALTALSLLIAPIVLGAWLGFGICRLRGTRIGGITFALAALLLPAAAVVGIFERFPFIGCWDAGLEGLLLGSGVLVGAHRAFAGARETAVTGAAIAASLVLLEIGVRWWLPAPPGFPSEGGVHFWLADAIRASGESHGWDMRGREVACAVIYGTQYAGIIDLGEQRDFRMPATYTPRPDATMRVLHVGDSMVFGFGVERNQTFTAALDRLEPSVEHVNAGIPALAPDAYLAVLETWVARQRFDAVVMYIFEDNDLRDLDGPFPCCSFEPLLVYDGRGAHLRCAAASPIDLSRAGFEWLRYNSPPPYLLRVIVGSSSAAAHVSAALVAAGHRYSLTSRSSADEQMAHLATILRTARDELQARRIRFGVVTLPGHNWTVSREVHPHLVEQIIATARQLGVPALDASPLLRAAAQRGEDIFVAPYDPHLNPAGHRLMAEWLHREWPGGGAAP